MNQHTTLDPGLEAILTHGRSAFPGEPGPSAEDLAVTEREIERKYGDPPVRVRDARGLFIHIGDCLAAIGLEPDLKAGAIDVLFLGRRHRISLIDLDADVEATLRGDGDRSIMTAGLPVG